jgi:hypothetical protein
MAIISWNVKPCVVCCATAKLIHVHVLLGRKLIIFHFRENRQISILRENISEIQTNVSVCVKILPNFLKIKVFTHNIGNFCFAAPRSIPILQRYTVHTTKYEWKCNHRWQVIHQTPPPPTTPSVLRVKPSWSVWEQELTSTHPLPCFYTVKRLEIFPSPAGMFPATESLVSDIPAEDGKIANLFYSVPSPHVRYG